MFNFTFFSSFQDAAYKFMSEFFIKKSPQESYDIPVALATSLSISDWETYFGLIIIFLKRVQLKIYFP